MKYRFLTVATTALSLSLALATPAQAQQWRKKLTPQEQASLAGEVYLHDLLEQKPYASLWRNTVWNQVPNKRSMTFSWLKDGGTSAPAERVQIDGQTFYKVDICKPHLCGGGDYTALVLINKQKVLVLQLYAVPQGKVSNGKKMQKLYGQPTEAELRYLHTWAKDFL